MKKVLFLAIVCAVVLGWSVTENTYAKKRTGAVTIEIPYPTNPDTDQVQVWQYGNLDAWPNWLDWPDAKPLTLKGGDGTGAAQNINWTIKLDSDDSLLNSGTCTESNALATLGNWSTLDSGVEGYPKMGPGRTGFSGIGPGRCLKIKVQATGQYRGGTGPVRVMFRGTKPTSLPTGFGLTAPTSEPTYGTFTASGTVNGSGRTVLVQLSTGAGVVSSGTTTSGSGGAWSVTLNTGLTSSDYVPEGHSIFYYDVTGDSGTYDGYFGYTEWGYAQGD